MLSRHLLRIALAAVSFMAPGTALADERITSFHSEIEVRPDASILVRETIDVVSEGDQIKRGIYRDFPTRYTDRAGFRTRVGFEILEVRRDGHQEPYHTENHENGIRIYVGQSSVELPHGDHVFEIAYRTTRQLGFFEEHDELYWNVTGNGWAFPILKASARVVLPGTLALSTDGYTGASGDRGKGFVASFDESGAALWRTRVPLPPGYGLTIVVTWPKGFVAAPTREQRLQWLVEDNRGALLGLGGLLVAFLYYLVVWIRVGRDPAAGPLVVRYEAPRGLSPAAVRYLDRMGFDDRTFAAAVLDMAVQGFLTIRERAGSYTLERTERDGKELGPDEKALHKALFDSRKKLELKPANHVAVRAARHALRDSLRSRLEQVYFWTNYRYLTPGMLLSLAAVVAAFLGDRGSLGAMVFMSVWLTIWTVGVTVLVWQAVAMWRTALGGGAAGRMAGLGQAIFLTVFSIPFLGGEVFGLYLLTRFGSVWILPIIGGAVALNFAFHFLLKAPTRAGRALLDEVEGFREFLTKVEADRLRRLIPPDGAPALYEKFLPYALALGVEQQWAQRFTTVLGDAVLDHHQPGWCSGDSFRSGGFTAMTAGVGGALSGAISSSATAPGSSSGGGGGGSSGGGGGGGGGGGW